jgi:hypothetical protein
MPDQTPLRQPGSTQQEAIEAQMEAERMRDVLLLLTSLIQREEATAALILDCLYDVAAKNLINQKLRSRFLNRLSKWVAKLSKPAFRVIALRWFKREVPQLITDWLYSKVQFAPTLPPETEVLAVTSQPAQLTSSEEYNRELVRLNAQVKRLKVLLLGVTCALSGTVAWVILNRPANLLQPTIPEPAAVMDQRPSDRTICMAVSRMRQASQTPQGCSLPR